MKRRNTQNLPQRLQLVHAEQADPTQKTNESLSKEWLPNDFKK